jgi:lipid-A-disaccharide synthase
VTEARSTTGSRARRTAATTRRGEAPRRVGIVAGEASGDLLGAGLIRSLRRRWPGAIFEGIGGPLMAEEGFRSHVPMGEITMMGWGGFARLFKILAHRHRITRHFRENPPDVFIGIDAPDFNLAVEHRLRQHGIRSVHYVSPTVWAWRRYRLPRIRRAVDLMLTLFPFEVDFYRAHGVPVVCVGHPLADVIPLRYEPRDYRRRLKLSRRGPLLALLPGSRVSEVERHAELFVQCARQLRVLHPDLQFVAPFVNRETREIFERALKAVDPGLPIALIDRRSREVLAACDAVLLASGTAALEAALYRKPMVVIYRLSWLSYWFIRLLAHVRLYSMPNHLAGRQIVPELIQSDARADKIVLALDRYLSDPGEVRTLGRTLERIHRSLRRNASQSAAEAIARLCARQAPGPAENGR